MKHKLISVSHKEKGNSSPRPLPHPQGSELSPLSADPSMVSAYMDPAGAAGAQAAPQGPAGPTTSPAYSSYQPTPTQGYQVGGEAAPSLQGP